MPIYINVLRSELFYKKWCDLIFEGRNKEYGAYRLRAQAGLRYRRALLGVLLLVGVFLGLCVYQAYRRYAAFRAFEEEMGLAKMSAYEPEEGFEFKALATGRHVPPPPPDEGVAAMVPEIVDEVEALSEIGTSKPDSLSDSELALAAAEADELAAAIEASLANDTTSHNADRTDLPDEGPTLQPVEVVKQMPQFPGGWRALMRFFDEFLQYPQTAIDKGQQGDMELSFYVDAQGNVFSPSVSKSISRELDAAALAVMRKMPKWKPATTESGAPTTVHMRIPIHFGIQNL